MTYQVRIDYQAIKKEILSEDLTQLTLPGCGLESEAALSFTETYSSETTSIAVYAVLLVQNKYQAIAAAF